MEEPAAGEGVGGDERAAEDAAPRAYGGAGESKTRLSICQLMIIEWDIC